MSETILLLGCGDLGIGLAHLLIQKHFKVIAVRRTPPQHCTLSNKLTWIALDLTHSQHLQSLPTEVDWVIYTPAPKRKQIDIYEALYHNALNDLIKHFKSSQRLRHWIQVSSTSVYGQNQGEWLDETSPTSPTTATAQFILSAEQTLINQPYFASTIVRFSGIYGPKRYWLLRKTIQQTPLRKNPPYYTNRIHRDDCINILLHLIELSRQNTPLAPLYLGTDDTPISEWEIGSWLSQMFEIEPLQTPDQDNLRSKNKRISNQLIKSTGYCFHYPDYQTGYTAVIKCLQNLYGSAYKEHLISSHKS